MRSLLGAVMVVESMTPSLFGDRIVVDEVVVVVDDDGGGM